MKFISMINSVRKYLMFSFFINYCTAFSSNNYSSHRIIKREQRPRITNAASCQLPYNTREKTFTAFDTKGDVINAQPGSHVPKFTTIVINCNPGYLTLDGESSSDVTCNLKGVWTPAIANCYKKCDHLQTANVDIKCERHGENVNCDQALLSGSKVRAKCKQLYHEEYQVNYPYIECRDDGSWDRPLMRCIPNCGQTRSKTLIHDGIEAQVGDFPWHVAIYQISKHYHLICGGTLISTNLVISAAHCFYDEASGQTRANKPYDYEIMVGKVTRSYENVDNAYQKKFKIKKLINFSKAYDPKFSGHYGADIIIMVLEKSITIDLYVLPACFNWKDTEFNPKPGTKGVVAGWGLDARGKPSKTLYYTQLPFISYNDCNKIIKGVTTDKFCGGGNTGPKPAQGDSGGGLLFRDSDNLFYLRGIVSTEDSYVNMSVITFTDVSNFKEWIYDVYKENEVIDEPPPLPPPNEFEIMPVTRPSCADGSNIDEYGNLCNPPTTRRTTQRPTTTTSRPTARPTTTHLTTTAEPDDEPHRSTVCDVHYGPDRMVVVTDQTNTRLHIATGVNAPRDSKIEIMCKPGYALPSREKKQHSVCHQNGWKPSVKPCLKTCSNLRPINVDLDCYYKNENVDCNSDLINGTIVRPRCKPLHHQEEKLEDSYREIRCQEDGQWDKLLYKCVPDCGMLNISPNGHQSLVGESPWHVAIYRISLSHAMVCSGTLITNNIVLSAAHCFFDEQEGTVANSTIDYEIVISKYTKNNKKIDNNYQKKYQVREIIFSKKGFNPKLSGHYGSDIVVIVLKQSVQITKFSLPACVAWSASTGFNPGESVPGRLSGWGKTNDVLMSTELPYISHSKCTEKLKRITMDKFCAGSEFGTTARIGDGGAGLLFRDLSNNRYYLRGILSKADNDGGSSVAPFTDISFYLSWLDEIRNKVEREQIRLAESQTSFW